MKAKEQLLEFLSTHPKMKVNMNAYSPKSEAMQKIKDNIEKVNIKVFTADWCPDCRIQVPRFFSILMAAGDSDFELDIIEVERGKKDKLGIAESFNVMAIPTFVFLKNGKELGRIIENPKGRMEEDIAGIICR